jgi:hypothetical protein
VCATGAAGPTKCMVFPKNKVETELNAFSAGGLVERVRARYVYVYNYSTVWLSV